MASAPMSLLEASYASLGLSLADRVRTREPRAASHLHANAIRGV